MARLIYKKTCFYSIKTGFYLAPTVRFERTTDRLTADCSTAELSRNIGGRYRN